MLAAAGGLILHASWLATLQGPHCIDDAYISFRYAENLVEGQGLVFNAGERVEGYTNFGWVMLVSGMQAAGLPVAVAARLFNLVLGALLVTACVWFVSRTSQRPLIAAALAGALLAADGSLARWSQDGLETVLFALLVFAGLARAVVESDDELSERRWPAAGLVLGMACLVRPEGLMYLGLGALAFVLSSTDRLRGLKRGMTCGSIGMALFVPWFVWRLSYYGYLLPNTFYAKVGGTSAQVARGVDYTANFWLWDRAGLAFLVLAALLLGSRVHAWKRWHLVFCVPAALHTIYVTAVGGDWMGPGRFFVPVVALVAVPVADLTAAWIASTRLRLAAIAACGAAVASILITSSMRSEAPSVAHERMFLDTRAAVGAFLAEHAQPEDRLLTNEIGQLAWDTGMYTADLHGLIDPHIAHMNIETLGEGKAGHEKVDFAYSLAQQPTWIVIPGLAETTLTVGSPLLEEFEVVPIEDESVFEPYRMLLRRTNRWKTTRR